MNKKKNRNIGSSFESWLDEVGLREEVALAASKFVLTREAMKASRRGELTTVNSPRDLLNSLNEDD